MTDSESLDLERQDLLSALNAQRGFLRYTTRDLTDEQARRATTVSALTLGGLIKHVAAVEERWATFIEKGADAFGETAGDADDHQKTFQLGDGETLQSVLEYYESVAQRTDNLVRNYPSLDDGHELPAAPWFPPGARWSARHTLLHILAETAHHSGHADIVREALDGQKTMG
ncbi:MAG TPA: DinB family protein [Chloroflexota bacterium]|nr:DinB family protein [Chloroflexota bacterium]